MTEQKNTVTIEKILKDASGGLNNSDPVSEIKENEFAVLENRYTDSGGWPGQKMPGADLIQYAPIDSQAFEVEAGTEALWHFNTDANPDADYLLDTVGAYNLQAPAVTLNAHHVDGLFQKGIRVQHRLVDVSGGSYLFNGVNAWFNGWSALALEAWLNPDEATSGKPEVVKDYLGLDVTLTDDGAPLAATTTGIYGHVVNGITVHRKWDAVAGKNSSGPYVKFTIRTDGISGKVTVLESPELATGRCYNIKGRYSATTGLAILEINGTIVASEMVDGAGNIFDDSTEFDIGGILVSISADSSTLLVNSVRGMIDEIRVSSVDIATFPFKRPRGNGIEYVKSDGTRQMIWAAEDGLFYTTGDGAWTKIKDGLSEVAFWNHVQVADILYLTNGVDEPFAWDGLTARGWGEGKSAPTVIASGSGTATAGRHRFAYSYLYGDEQTGLSPYAEITLDSPQDVTVYNIPARHSDCTAVLLWATKAGEETFYLFRRIDNEPTADTVKIEGPYVAGTPASPDNDTGGFGVDDSVLGTGDFAEITAEALTTEMPNPKYLMSQFERIFGGGMDDEQYTVRFCLTGNPNVWLGTNFINFKHHKGVLTALSKFRGEWHAHLGGRGCVVMRGDTPSSWAANEDLHPDKGCIDHFGIVYRTMFKGEAQSDDTVLVFPGQDDFYEYRGFDFVGIGKNIRKTYEGLSFYNSVSKEYSATTEVQFRTGLSTLSGGSATANISNDKANSDGLNAETGTIQIFDQYDYHSHWGKESAYAPSGFTGKLIAICKGAGANEFFFSTDVAGKIYRTTDNFKSIALVSASDPLPASMAGHVVIEIVRRGTDAAYFMFTDKDNGSGGSGGGNIYKYTVGVGWVELYTGGDLFYENDIPWQIFGLLGSSTSVVVDAFVPGIDPAAPESKNFYFVGSGSNDNLKNFYLNHSQKIYATPNTANSYISVLDNPSLDGLFSGVAQIAFSGYSNLLTSGFYSARDESRKISTGQLRNGQTVYGFYKPSTSNFRLSFTNREKSRWQGGSARPQAIWTGGSLMFVCSGAEDAYGNRKSFVCNKPDSATALTKISSLTGVCTALHFSGSNGYFIDVVEDTAGGTGFIPRLNSFALGTPGTNGSGVTLVANLTTNALPLRIQYNPTIGKFAACGKAWTVNAKDSYTFKGMLAKLSLAGVYDNVKYFTDNDNAGLYPVELALQTVTPRASYALMTNQTEAEDDCLWKFVPGTDAALSQLTEAYDDETVGSYSNMIFVASSGQANSYEWPDRLYFSIARDTDADGDADEAKPAQVGVPGTWEVRGAFLYEEKNLGPFTSFGTLEAEYSGDIGFFVRNAAGQSGLAASEKQVTANAKILGFAAPGPWVQWRLVLRWVANSSLSLLGSSPKLSFVNIKYYAGASVFTRIVGIHHEGRTRWSVSKSGSDANDLEIIYQTNNTWTLATGRRIVGYAKFLNDLVCFNDYQFGKMETGQRWFGESIKTKAVTGCIMHDTNDKYIRNIKANLMSYVNKDFPEKQGWMKITPIGGGADLAPVWFVPLEATLDESLPRQMQAVQDGAFKFGWARAFAFKIETSDDEVSYIADPDQTEELMSLIVKFRVSPARFYQAVD